MVLPWLALATAALYRWRWLSMPLGERFDGWRERLLAVVFAVLGLWWVAALFRAGGAAPLPWVPLLNPLELAQLAALVLALRWQLGDARRLQPALGILFALLGFAWLTALVLRAVHHWGDAPWSDALLSTSLAQTSLTVAWSVLGMLGWVIGLEARPAHAVAGRRGADGRGAGEAGGGGSPAPWQSARHRLVHRLRPAVHGGGVFRAGAAEARRR